MDVRVEITHEAVYDVNVEALAERFPDRAADYDLTKPLDAEFFVGEAVDQGGLSLLRLHGTEVYEDEWIALEALKD